MVSLKSDFSQDAMLKSLKEIGGGRGQLIFLFLSKAVGSGILAEILWMLSRNIKIVFLSFRRYSGMRSRR